MPQESVGVALGAQVGHLVAHRESPEGTLIYTVLPKSAKNRPKRGYPLFWTGFELAPPTWGVHAKRRVEVEFNVSCYGGLSVPPLQYTILVHLGWGSRM